MATVTLIGERHAEVGHEFVYAGEVDGCTDCPFRNQCLNLEPGQSYRVTDVRTNAQALPCAVHEDDVVAVEVEAATRTVNVDTRHAYSGNKTTIEGQCPHISCPSHSFCRPDGIAVNDNLRIVEIHGSTPHDTCLLDRELTHVDVVHDS